MKTLFNLIGTMLTLVIVVALGIGLFMFGMKTQQTADEEALNPSNYEVKISSGGIEVDSTLTKSDIMKKTVFNIADDIDAWFYGEDDSDLDDF